MRDGAGKGGGEHELLERSGERSREETGTLIRAQQLIVSKNKASDLAGWGSGAELNGWAIPLPTRALQEPLLEVRIPVPSFLFVC